MFCQDISELRSLQIIYTPLKFKMEPENQPLEKEIPFGNHSFQVPAVKLWSCMHILFWKTYQGTWSFSHQPSNPPRSRVDPSALAPCKLRRPGLAWVCEWRNLWWPNHRPLGWKSTSMASWWFRAQLVWIPIGSLYERDLLLRDIKKKPNHRDPNHQLNTRWENKPCK